MRHTRALALTRVQASEATAAQADEQGGGDSHDDNDDEALRRAELATAAAQLDGYELNDGGCSCDEDEDEDEFLNRAPAAAPPRPQLVPALLLGDMPRASYQEEFDAAEAAGAPGN